MVRFALFALASSAVFTTLHAQNPAPGQQIDSTQVKARLAEEDRLRNDWPNLQKYSKMNAELPAPAPGEDRVVFMGNSITEIWARYFPTMFPGKPYINRGIG
ncbi:MAG: capsular biosynthesis protein, partial [Gemmatimonadales bacterium]